MWWSIICSVALSLSWTLCDALPLQNEDVSIHVKEEVLLTVPEDLPSDVSDDGFLIDDMVIPVNRNAVKNRNMLWPQGIVYYVFDSSISNATQQVIKTAMAEIENDVNGKNSKCIQFKPRTTEDNYARIFKGEGCYSTVGYVRKAGQDVSLGKNCGVKGVVMHELLHTLGFFHEQNLYDRDDYINVDLDNVVPEKKSNFNKMPQTKIDTLGVPYSFESIMHYGPYAMAADKSKPVMSPKPAYEKGQAMGQRFQLAISDVLKIQKLYQCTEDTSHITTVRKEMITTCGFETDLCSLKSEKGNAKWTVTKDASDDGPVAGHTNGADGYVVVPAAGNNGKVAKLSTPTTSDGTVCVDFYLFQKGPSSRLQMSVSGRYISPQTVKNFEGVNRNQWFQNRITLTIPKDLEFKVTFEAHMSSGGGDVAIDDLNMYQGACV